MPDVVTSSGRTLRPTVAFRSYWYFASERQNILYRRLRGDAVLTGDRILRSYRFTNAYRAADRVSQFLINEVIPGSDAIADDIVFRVLLFKIFNSIDTWRLVEQHLGEPIHWGTFVHKRYDDVFCAISEHRRIYSNAYIMPNPPHGHRYKHTNHLALLSSIINMGIAQRVENASSLADLYQIFRSVPSFGPFLAFQYAIDINYTELCSFDEDEFVVAGPGAVDGIRKCFTDVAGYSDADVIKIVAAEAAGQFQQYGFEFKSLWGRALKLIDCQNLFCEVDKYSRLAHPELAGESGRVRIKQRYSTSKGALPEYGFPKHWNINTAVPYAVDVSPVGYH